MNEDLKKDLVKLGLMTVAELIGRSSKVNNIEILQKKIILLAQDIISNNRLELISALQILKEE